MSARILLRELPRILARVAIALLALLGGVLWLARLAAPWPVPGEQVEDAQVAAAIDLLSESGASAHRVFLSIDERDPDGPVMRRLQDSLPSATLAPISERPMDGIACAPAQLLPLGPCQADNVLRLEFLAMPLWGTALIGASTSACRSELTMVRVTSRWHVVSRRRICV